MGTLLSIGPTAILPSRPLFILRVFLNATKVSCIAEARVFKCLEEMNIMNVEKANIIKSSPVT